MKALLGLAYKAGALSVLNNRDIEKMLDPEHKKHLEKDLEAEFELWYQAMAPLSRTANI